MLHKITPELVRKYIRKFDNDKRYYLADEAISELLRIFPKNNNVEHILLKVSVINKFYYTNIIDVFTVAKHIKKLNIDWSLSKEDPKIVNRIARVHLSKGERNFYSFATKYCSWHNLKGYPIYDRFVEITLRAYKEQDKEQDDFLSFTRNDLRDYPKFKRIMVDFKTHYGLHSFSFKEIDKFLFFYGRRLNSVTNEA